MLLQNIGDSNSCDNKVALDVDNADKICAAENMSSSYRTFHVSSSFSDCVIFCFVILRLIFLGSLIFEGVSRSPATFMMELVPTSVNNFLLITNVARISVLDVAGSLDPPLCYLRSYF